MQIRDVESSNGNLTKDDLADFVAKSLEWIMIEELNYLNIGND